jgi:hypothetical protein
MIGTVTVGTADVGLIQAVTCKAFDSDEVWHI